MDLPRGKSAGSETSVGNLSVSAGASFKGFGITGEFPVNLGLSTAGRYYANLV